MKEIPLEPIGSSRRKHDDLWEAFLEFMHAESVDARRNVVQQHPELITREAIPRLKVIAMLEKHPDEHQVIDSHLSLLLQCSEQGVSALRGTSAAPKAGDSGYKTGLQWAMENKDYVWNAFMEFVHAGSPGPKRKVLEEHPELLSRSASALLKMMAIGNPDQEQGRIIDAHVELLKRCNKLGIERALSEDPDLEKFGGFYLRLSPRTREAANRLRGAFPATQPLSTSGLSVLLALQWLARWGLAPYLSYRLVDLLRAPASSDAFSIGLRLSLDAVQYMLLSQCVVALLTIWHAWQTCFRLHGKPPLEVPLRILRLDRLTILRYRDNQLAVLHVVVALPMLAAAAIRESAYLLSLGVGVLTFGLLFLLHAAIPPSVLFLTRSTDYSRQMQQKIGIAVRGGRVVSLLYVSDEEKRIPGHLRANLFRTRNPEVWRAVVAELSCLVPIMVVDLREPSEAVLWELDWLRLTYSRAGYLFTVISSEDRDKIERLMAGAGVSGAPRCRVFTEAELYRELREITGRQLPFTPVVKTLAA